MSKEQRDKKQKEKTQAPVADGDTRPDKNVAPDPAIVSMPRKPDKSLTPERAADTDSLEDFKDAK